MSSLLATRLGDLRLANPLVLASGVMGVSASSLGFVATRGAGAVTAKSCSLEPRTGHPSPVVHVFDQGMLNAVGLSNPGARAMAGELAEYRRRFPDVPLVASVFGATVDEFARVTEILVEAGPDLVEVNVSCPNVSSELGAPFGADFDATARVTRAVVEAAGGVPVSTKLTTACPSIGRMARVCEEAGASAITAINTVGPGMLVDLETRRPVLSNRVGGVSGPAILPVAIKSVWEVRRSCGLPIIGTGGVETAGAALQMVMAGADAVAIGTGFYRRGPGVFREVAAGMEAWLLERGLDGLDAVRGVIRG